MYLPNIQNQNNIVPCDKTEAKSNLFTYNKSRISLYDVEFAKNERDFRHIKRGGIGIHIKQ